MKTRLRIAGDDFAALHGHLFRADRDEYGAIILAGISRSSSALTLIGRELHLLGEDDFIAGEFGYRQIAPHALARLSNRASELGLALVSCHSHPSATTSNRLSGDDLRAHERVFPHLLDILDGPPVAGIAFGSESAAGEVWASPADRYPLERVDVIGTNLITLTPAPRTAQEAEARFDRQARMFGTQGQMRLRGLSVSVVGIGGGGSMVVEQLAHLGIGEIVIVDFDVVKAHNLSRIVGATETDAAAARTKVEVAADHVARIDPGVRFEALDGDLAEESVARRVAETDFLFLCTDTITSRLVANAIAQSYLLPMVQIGSKVDLLDDGRIESVYVAVRPVSPRHGCLACAGLIDSAALQLEAATDEERAAQNYLGLPEVIDPSVITLNGIGASTATNFMLMSSVGLAGPELANHCLFDARHGTWLALEPQRDERCLWCGSGPRSRFAMGDHARLPLKLTAAVEDVAEPPPEARGGVGERIRRWLRR